MPKGPSPARILTVTIGLLIAMLLLADWFFGLPRYSLHLPRFVTHRTFDSHGLPIKFVYRRSWHDYSNEERIAISSVKAENGPPLAAIIVSTDARELFLGEQTSLHEAVVETALENDAEWERHFRFIEQSKYTPRNTVVIDEQGAYVENESESRATRQRALSYPTSLTTLDGREWVFLSSASSYVTGVLFPAQYQFQLEAFTELEDKVLTFRVSCGDRSMNECKRLFNSVFQTVVIEP